jgi:PhzF family phenazine biosynthesis protein
MNIPLYQVDAFASAVFTGNPAAVCPLDSFLDDAVLQAVAAENNLSETAFLVDRGDRYDLRWFTPEAEVDLCGHATLAAAQVVFTRLAPGRTEVAFETRSGRLTVRLLPESTGGGLLEMDFPALPAKPVPTPETLLRALGRPPVEVLAMRENYLAVYQDEGAVRSLAPDFALLKTAERNGVIVTAAGSGAGVDFVSRYFAPRVGIPEDPVTGSAHSTLVPYWAGRLGKDVLHARQLSRRGGELFCRHLGDRVAIAGRAAPYLAGTGTLP